MYLILFATCLCIFVTILKLLFASDLNKKLIIYKNVRNPKSIQIKLFDIK